MAARRLRRYAAAIHAGETRAGRRSARPSSAAVPRRTERDPERPARARRWTGAVVLGAALWLVPSAMTMTAAQAPFDFTSALAAAEAMPRLHSLLVSHDGDLVLERYFNDRDGGDIANVKSVSKSLISALVGIAISEGRLDGVDQTIGEFFPAELAEAADAPKRAITIGNLLAMQAGLETTSNRNYGAWVLSPNWIEFALDQPLEGAPGEGMQYSTGSTHLLSAILTKATGKSTLEYARDVLAGPLGFHLAAWPRDPQGVYFGGNDMELTPRQMLAFGNLYLANGRAGERQIVPAAWVDASFMPRAESPREEGRYYGYGWWLREMAGFVTPYAWGFGGQFIVLVPELDVVVVMTSASTPGDDRRRHTRRLYDFVEYEVIPAAERAAGGS
jgi:CubicO group peptidase (beta-lactamase class C family)